MTSRRGFLKTGAALLAARYTRALPSLKRLPLGFSTLGCPTWPWARILDFAAEHQFASIELRGILTNMDLTKVPELAPERLAEAKRQLAAHGLVVSDLGASAQMHDMDPMKHAAQLDEAHRFIDLAQALGAPYVRVFGNEYVKDVPRDAMLAHIGYRGFYSFEWEKRWHPEIEEPEVAFAQYANVAAGYLREAQNSKG